MFYTYDRARGGTLLVDEVYRLVPVDAPRDFGPEAVDTLMAAMEGEPHTTTDRPAIILAGYPGSMGRVTSSNPGLARRITDRFVFPDYSVGELVEIVQKMAHADGYRVACTSAEIEEKVASLVSAEVLANHNAGYSARLFADAKKQANNRLAEDIILQDVEPSTELLTTLNLDDFTKAIDFVQSQI